MTQRFRVALLRYAFYCLLIAQGLAGRISPVAADEPSLLEYFHACGIGDDAFAKFADDRQIATEEFDVIYRIAVRLRDCPPDRLERMIRSKSAATSLPSPADAKGLRGRVFHLQGSLASVERVEDSDREPLWRCVVALSEYPRRAVVYVTDLPEKLRNRGAGQRVALDGVFVKYVPGVRAEPMAVVVAPRLEWRAESSLGNLGMDLGLLEAIRDDCPLTSADHDAFYRLLHLAKNADLAGLNRDAQRLDESSPGLPALFRDPAAQRGRLLKLRGVACRVVKVPIDDPAIVSRLGTDHYFEIDLMAQGSQGNPLVLCTLDLPNGMPLGGPASYAESVEVTGFFFKNWKYPTPLSQSEKAAHPGSSQASQTAGLLIGPAPQWTPTGRETKSSHSTAVTGLLALVTIGVCLLLWHLRQSDQEFSRKMMIRK